MKINKLFALASLFAIGNIFAATELAEKSKTGPLEGLVNPLKDCKKDQVQTYKESGITFSFYNKDSKPIKLSVWNGDNLKPSTTRRRASVVAVIKDEEVPSEKIFNSKKIDITKDTIIRILSDKHDAFYKPVLNKTIYVTWKPEKGWFDKIKAAVRGQKAYLYPQSGPSTYTGSPKGYTASCLSLGSNVIVDTNENVNDLLTPGNSLESLNKNLGTNYDFNL